MKKVDPMYKTYESTSRSSISYSGSNSSGKVSWKRAIAEDGSLFYVRYTQQTGHLHNRRSHGPITNNINNNTPKLSAMKNESVKELVMVVSSLDRFRFGRRSSITESMLGFGVVPFPDNADCLMVSNIFDNALRDEPPFLKKGDWFKSLDNIEVRTSNIERLLLQYNVPSQVKLIFKGSSDCTVLNENTICEIRNYDEFATTYKHLFKREFPDHKQKDFIFLALVVNLESFESDANEYPFFYPCDQMNFLYKARGSFLTLYSVIKNDLKSKIMSSLITVGGIKYHIVYGRANNAFIVCAFSSVYQSEKSAKASGNDFINFFSLNVTEFHTPQMQQHLIHVCDIFKIKIENGSCNSNLSASFASSLHMALPKEAQLRICDALSELESMDYKKWNESQESCRDFTVYGTALYYKNYLLTSNLPVAFKTRAECFLRMRGINEFILTQNITEMYVWEKMEQVDAPNEHFQAICVRNDLFLVVILKGILPTKSNLLSRISYMEEIADTIDYLIACGIQSVSEFWIESSKRPHVPQVKFNSLSRRKYKFTSQKDISLENYDSNLSVSTDCIAGDDANKVKKTDVGYSLERTSHVNKTDTKHQEQNGNLIEPLLNEARSILPLNLTTGWSNDLKYFLHINLSDATIMQPLKPTFPRLQMNLIKEYILEIHDVLQLNSNLKRLQEVAMGGNKITAIVKEHSLTVDFASDCGNKECVTIVGRLFSFPLKEVYVCFGQDFSQNLVELSFRMSFLNIG